MTRSPSRGSEAPTSTADLSEPGGERLLRLSSVGTLLQLLLVVAGLGALIADIAETGPAYLADAGALAVGTAYSWMLATRIGGRSWLAAPLVAGGGAVALWLDYDFLRAGAAVTVIAVGAALGVMITVPAVRFVQAAREAALALVTAAIGALASMGLAPMVNMERFGYLALGAAFTLVIGLVYRLGAGLPGLGTRGLVVVVVGVVGLGATLVYAELLRRYGTTLLIESVQHVSSWGRKHMGAFPRPVPALLGIPALAWGAHQRARRRQGWWVSAFGVAATVPIGLVLMNPLIRETEAVLSVLYTVLVGLVISFLVIRVDLALTGSRGRGGRRAEEASAVRPEPSRFSALL
jgi:hypothetical protein